MRGRDRRLSVARILFVIIVWKCWSSCLAFLNRPRTYFQARLSIDLLKSDIWHFLTEEKASVTRTTFISGPESFVGGYDHQAPFTTTLKSHQTKGIDQNDSANKNEEDSLTLRQEFLECLGDTGTLSTMTAMASNKASSSKMIASAPSPNKWNITSKTARTLEGRLLCAAECAYDLQPPYFAGVGYLAGRQVTKLSKGVNSCLVGRTMDGIVISFRGTQANSPLDWLQNAAIYLRSVEGIPGRVHSGFYRAAKALYPALKQSLRQRFSIQSPDDPTPIYLAGHSKGGSLASLIALLMHQDRELPNPAGVFSFGAAKVGDSTFRTHFNETIPYQTSYENYLDLIPFLPPGRTTYQDMDDKMVAMVEDIMWSESERYHAKGHLWRYQPIGRRVYIDPDGNLIPVTRELDRRRIKDIENKTLLSFAEFRRAHCSACPDVANDKDDGTSLCSGGYFCALAPEICDVEVRTASDETETQ